MWSSVKSWIFGDSQEDLKDEDLLAELDLNDDNKPEERIEHGKITDLEEDHGIIDDEFYFPRTLFPKISFRPMQIGDELKYKATRKSKNQQWVVSEILYNYGGEESSSWNNENPATNYLSKDVGKVINVTKSQIFVEVQGENSTEELILAQKLLPFQAQIGDLLCLELAIKSQALDDLQDAKILSAEALRSNIVPDGIVTSWWNTTRKGIVDGSIYFDVDSLTCSYLPKVNDNVRAHAIECEPSDSNRKCNWRATRLVPKGALATIRDQTVDTSAIAGDPEYLSGLLRDKFKIHIDDLINVGMVQKDQKIEQIIEITNDSDEAIIVENVATLSHNIELDMLKFPMSLEAKSTRGIKIHCHGNDFGRHKILAIFKFIKPDEDQTRFEIGTQIMMEVGNSLLNSLQMVEPSSKFNYFSSSKACENVIRGQRINSKKKSMTGPLFARKRLAEHPIPKRFESLYYDQDPSALLDQFPYLGEDLSFANYKEKFANLLYLEELEQMDQMAQFRMNGVSFDIKGPYLALQVPGLAEKRPSLALGDAAIATLSNTKAEQSYEGCIHEVKSTSVLLKFDERFHNLYCGEFYDIEFQMSRGQFKRMHQAIQEVVKNFGQEVLFPKEIKPIAPQVDFTMDNPKIPFKVFKNKHKIRNLRLVHPQHQSLRKRKSVVESLFSNSFTEEDYGKEWIVPQVPFKLKQVQTRLAYPLDHEFKLPPKNSKVLNYFPRQKLQVLHQSGQLVLKWINDALNAEQKNAVLRILNGQARPLPYIIYGPPGTGKTVTVVETIIQIFKLRTNSRILVVTPSNSAADLIVERIHHSGQVQIGDMARFNAFQRAPEVIPELVKPYSFANEDHFLAKVVRHRIVVATCSTAGTLYKLGLAEGHFTHCFIDEAGETTEPESMNAIGLLASSSQSQIILAGDPQQLGPVLLSAEAKIYGLELSFLERLSLLPIYQRNEKKFKDHGNYDPMLVTKLVKNYRSHQDIIAIPSKLFYDDELIAQKKETTMMNNFGQVLINEDHPIIFHGVRGQNYQEGDSPSWFNPTEALQVASYVQKLLNLNIDPENIGIIAPYRQQVAKIKHILQSLDLPIPKIGSVEEFQGQEKPIIIVTTVRSAEFEAEAGKDSFRGLGFLRSDKRFNVAITRAMNLLIVIGDPHLLGGDSSWLAFIKYCVSLGAYTGCDLPLGLT